MYDDAACQVPWSIRSQWLSIAAHPLCRSQILSANAYRQGHAPASTLASSFMPMPLALPVLVLASLDDAATTKAILAFAAFVETHMVLP